MRFNVYGHGRTQDFPRGGFNFVWGSGQVACREAACGPWRSHALARGFEGMLPQEFFLNDAIWCVLELIFIKFYFNKI